MQASQIRKLFTLIYYCLLNIPLLYSQTEHIQVRGTMTDSHGMAIPGVSVYIEGTTQGTICDVNGNYSIEAPLGSTLVFSFVGMKTRKAIVTLTGLNPLGSRQIIPYNTHQEDSRFGRTEEVKELMDSLEYDQRMKKYKKYLADSLVLNNYRITTENASE